MSFIHSHGNSFVCRLLIFQLFIFFASSCLAEELEPRRWAHLPIDTNFAGTAYAYTKADISFDPVLKIEEGQVDLHTWGVKYIRSFSLFDKSARVDFLQGYQKGRWKGLLNGAPKQIKRSGWTDTVRDSRSTSMARRRYRDRSMLNIAQQQRLKPLLAPASQYSCRQVITWTIN